MNPELNDNEENVKDELILLSSNLGEIAIDNILTNGIFKEIPIIKTVISVAKLGKTASDSLLLIRLIKFINSLELKSDVEIENFKNKYFSLKGYNKIGSKILLILEKADDELKIKWLAKSLNLLINKQISKNDFLRMSSIINSVFPSDVEKIKVFKENKRITTINFLVDSYILEHLYSSGLLSSSGFDGGNAFKTSGGTIFVLNKYGNIFLNHLLDE